MFLEQDAVLGLSRFVAKYEAYVREMKAQKNVEIFFAEEKTTKEKAQTR